MDMQVSTNERLRAFAANLLPTQAEVTAAQRHFQTIRTRLQQTFGVSRFIPIGSHARGTAINVYSDIDFLAVLPRKSARWGGGLVSPQTFLRNVAEDLASRYTATSVRRDGQAIVLKFAGGAQSVDVVPGIFEGMNETRPMYLIPGSDDDWITTSPETHDMLFERANGRSGGKLAGVARLIKAWKYGRTPAVPLSSFYTDLLLSTTDVATGVRSYGECLDEFFRILVNRDARGLRDPAGISGIVTASASNAMLDRLFSAAQTASDRARAAIHAERRYDHAEAIRQWGLVFNRSV